MDTKQSTSPNHKSAAQSRDGKQVGILGTGNFASAFAQRLRTTGYSAVLGSRQPERRHPQNDVEGDVRVTTLEDCVKSSDVIVVALHVEHYEETFTPELSGLCSGKTLVDVSNSTDPTPPRTARSNAHLLASLAPEAVIVKAFNSVPAYVLENGVTSAGGRRTVSVASDDVTARAAVCALARELGFEPAEKGGLRQAGWMEERERRLFPGWTLGVAASVGAWLFWFLFAVSRFYITDSRLQWDQLPLKMVNKVFGAATLSVLSLTYFPSTCAAFLQMYRGTKRQRFPGWLDLWLRSRKQLGLMAFALISMHAVISALILSPTYMSSWFVMKDPVRAELSSNATDGRAVLVVVRSHSPSWMTWIGELSLLVGVAAYLLMALLAVTSLPSVTNALHFSEWRFLHSSLGCIMLTLAVVHVCVMGVPKWLKTGFPLVLFRVKFLSIVCPTLVLACRLLLLLPWVSGYLRRIRLGWERQAEKAERHSAVLRV